MKNAVEILHLTKRFGSRTAVSDLTLTVRPGEIFSLLGVNGAGKTTALRVLCGLIPADEGTVTVMGHPAGTAAARRATGLSPQETAVAENLTVRENLELTARLYGMNREEARAAAQNMIDAMHLHETAGRRAKKLSGGWQRRLSIAMSLIPDPDVLILDEPTLGLDVIARRELWTLIRSLRGKTTILLTTHYLEEAEALSDRIAVMSEGRLCAQGTAQELLEMTGAAAFEDAFVALAGREGLA
ncbi:MAG: ABC transporter ATP-binding protein [Clostridia bacterium]|nr:ABC transporter ATP-binding protein [Clostridia bacterium]